MKPKFPPKLIIYSLISTGVAKIGIMCQLFLGLGQHLGSVRCNLSSNVNGNCSRGHNTRSQRKHMILRSVWSLFHADQTQFNEDMTKNPLCQTKSAKYSREHQRTSTRMYMILRSFWLKTLISDIKDQRWCNGLQR